MQLASHGASRISSFIPRGIGIPSGPLPARSIHTPSFVPRSPQAQTLLSQSRSLFSRFVAHLTAPGLAAPHAPSVLPSAVRARTIHQGLSLPVRHKLAQPFGTPHLPRAPTLPRPNSVTTLGLGTARNFHAGRPLFQNVIENVPIAGRAFWEADWELKTREERERMGKSLNKTKDTQYSKEMLKPRLETIAQAEKENEAPSKSEYESEMEHYFSRPAVPAVTTYLLIPLAPTPTNRAPLAPISSPTALLPLPALAALHASHSTHALHVSSLFARLDAADVWGRGVTCTAHGDSRGVCTVLRVEFAGWSAQEVRGVIGESGSGWCVLEEVREEPEDEGLLTEMSSLAGDDAGIGVGDIDPAASFVLPTLDFSSSFVETSPSSSSSPLSLRHSPSDISSPTGLFSCSESDWGSDMDGDSEFSHESASWIEPPRSASSWMGFSSEFVHRLRENEREGAVY